MHVNYLCDHLPVAAGTTFDVSYTCELYGDGQTGLDELKAIGLRSLELGDIAID